MNIASSLRVLASTACLLALMPGCGEAKAPVRTRHPSLTGRLQLFRTTEGTELYVEEKRLGLLPSSPLSYGLFTYQNEPLIPHGQDVIVPLSKTRALACEKSVCAEWNLGTKSIVRTLPFDRLEFKVRSDIRSFAETRYTVTHVYGIRTRPAEPKAMRVFSVSRLDETLAEVATVPDATGFRIEYGSPGACELAFADGSTERYSLELASVSARLRGLGTSHGRLVKILDSSGVLLQFVVESSRTLIDLPKGVEGFLECSGGGWAAAWATASGRRMSSCSVDTSTPSPPIMTRAGFYDGFTFVAPGYRSTLRAFMTVDPEGMWRCEALQIEGRRETCPPVTAGRDRGALTAQLGPLVARANDSGENRWLGEGDRAVADARRCMMAAQASGDTRPGDACARTLGGAEWIHWLEKSRTAPVADLGAAIDEAKRRNLPTRELVSRLEDARNRDLSAAERATAEQARMEKLRTNNIVADHAAAVTAWCSENPNDCTTTGPKRAPSELEDAKQRFEKFQKEYLDRKYGPAK